MSGRDDRNPQEAALARFGRAFGHPLRLRILLALADGREASPLDLSRRFAKSLATVSYHVRYLAQLQALELRRTVPRRGALQHFYAIAPEIRPALPTAAAGSPGRRRRRRDGGGR